MKVLVDTSVWSPALRKQAKRDDAAIRELHELIREMRVVMIGPIRQELLTGISDTHVYERLRDGLSAFEDVPIETGHYELAAHCSNQCRRHGIQGSHIDFLICAVGIKNNYSLFTLDKDFAGYKKYIGIQLHTVRKELL